MHFTNFLLFISCVSPVTIAHPLGLHNRAFGAPSAKSVSQAVDNFAKDADLVSNALNTLPTMTNKKQIQSTAKEAFDAETDEDNQRSVLATAAGTSGRTADSKIQKFTPTVLKGLKAMAQQGTTSSVQKNIPIIEKARNPNILPSITQLSNAAMNSKGLQKTAKDFEETTGSSKIAAGGNDKSSKTDINNKDTGNQGTGNKNSAKSNKNDDADSKSKDTSRDADNDNNDNEAAKDSD